MVKVEIVWGDDHNGDPRRSVEEVDAAHTRDGFLVLVTHDDEHTVERVIPRERFEVAQIVRPKPGPVTPPLAGSGETAVYDRRQLPGSPRGSQDPDAPGPATADARKRPSFPFGGRSMVETAAERTGAAVSSATRKGGHGAPL